MDSNTHPVSKVGAAKRGAMLSVDGIDGGGKSSMLKMLHQELVAKGWDVVVTREPGGTPLAEKLRGLVLNSPMDPLTETLLVFAARRDHIKTVIEPALNRGAIVLCDRFTDATYAYQGWGREFGTKHIATLEAWVQGEFQPDLTVLYDLPPEVAAMRLSGARGPDRFEEQDVYFFERVRKGYEARIEEHPQRFAKINANQERECVWRDTLAAVKERMAWLGL